MLTWGLFQAHAQLVFEAEDVSSPSNAWAENEDSEVLWNLWSTDVDAEKKWSGGVVLRSPSVRADRENGAAGAPPLHTVIGEVPPGVYTVELKTARVLGLSTDGKTWERYTGGPVFRRVRVAPGDVIEFWIDDRFAMEREEQRGPGYYDCVYLFPHRGVKDGIPNAGFETLDDDGSVSQWGWWSRENVGRAVPTTDAVHGGERAVRITHSGERDWAFTNAARLAVSPGTELCVKAWMQGKKGTQDVSINAVGYGNGELVSWTTGRGRASMTGKWVQAKGYFQVPDDVDTVQVRFTGHGTTDVIVDEVALAEEKQVFPEKPPVDGWAEERVREQLGRGVAALPRGDGSVYLSWRLLDSDPANIAFDVYRQVGDEAERRLNQAPIVRTCDFVDRTPPRTRCSYIVRPAGDTQAVEGRATWAEPGDGNPYVRIPLDQEDTLFQKVGVADLDGDGTYDFVIKHPNKNIDPWIKYWYKSPETYKLEGYLSDGTFLWRIDLGWGIERGIWYSPYIVMDLTGDGKAEVAAKVGEGDPRDEDGRVTSGAEYVVVWDGMTGTEIARAPWPEREAFTSYNYASRNQIAVAYLDGKTPCLLTLRGTYTRMIVHAYHLTDGTLERLWVYDNDTFGGRYWGQGAHMTLAADIDGDTRDEVILGSTVIDDNGVPLWSTGRGHPDAHYLSDIDPTHPGMEIAYVIETRQRRNGGLNVVDARTGEELWALDTPTRHVHGKGMCADIDPTVPGMEVYGADADGHKLTENRWFFSADGRALRQGTDCPWGFSINTVYWDADLQKEIAGGKILDYKGNGMNARISGSQRLRADIIGDWREEIVTSVEGELRVYSTTIPAMDRRVCLMQDPSYRLATAMNAMGYTQDPTLSYNPADRSPNLNLTFVSPTAGEPHIQVVMAAGPDNGLKGKLSLHAAEPVQLATRTLAIELAPGRQVVHKVAISPGSKGRLSGMVEASFDGASTQLQAGVLVKLAGGFLTDGILAQAEEFGAQTGGSVHIREDKAKTMGAAISHWDDTGHALSWTVNVPADGTYHLVLRYCAPHQSSRRLTVDDAAMGTFTLPTTGGYGSQAVDWEHGTVALDDAPLPLHLSKGPHIIGLENVDGKGCNLDYIALVSINEKR